MPTATLQQNVAVLLQHYERLTVVYFRVYGAGNVRLGSNKTQLEQSAGAVIGAADGVPFAAADWAANQRYVFWEGDLYAISDAPNNPIMYYAPQYEYTIDRGKGTPAPNVSVVQDSEIVGNLSTYR